MGRFRGLAEGRAQGEPAGSAAPADRHGAPPSPAAPPEAGSPWGAWRAAPALLLFLVAFRDLALWQPGGRGLQTWDRWLFAASETAPQLVFAVVLWLLYARRRRLAAALRSAGSVPWAVPWLLLGLTLFGWSRYADAPPLLIAALAAIAVGSCLLIAGPPLGRAVALPVLILLLAIPAPAVVTNAVIYPVQLWTAEFATWVLGALGITAVREGDVIYLAGRSFQVIETCSGLRFVKILTLLSTAWALYFSTPWLHGALLILAAPFLAFFLNGLRVLTLILNPESDVASTHSLQGAVVFVSGAFALYALDWALARWLPPSREPTPRGRGADPSPAGRRPAVALLTGVAGLMAVVSVWMPEAKVEERPPLRGLPIQIDGWTERPAEGPNRRLGSVYFSQRWSRTYERGPESVSVFLGADDRMHRDRSLLSPKNAVPDPGWEVEERRSTTLGPGSVPVEAVVARSESQRVLVYHGYQGVESSLREGLRALFALDRPPFRRPDPARVFRLSTPLGGSSSARQEAESRLRLLFGHLEPWLFE